MPQLENKELKQFFKKCPFPVVITKESFQIVFTNEAADQLLEEEFISTQDKPFFHEMIKKKSTYESFFSSINQSLSQSFEINIKKPDDSTSSMLGHVIKLQERNNDTLFAWLLFDISVYNYSLNVMRTRLEESESTNHAKTYFLANVGHSIKSQLNSIIGLYQLVKEKVGSSNIPNEIDQLLKRIDFSVEQLHSLASNLLNIRSIEESKITSFEPSSFFVEQVIQAIFELYREMAAIKSIWFTYHIAKNVPESIKTDKRILVQILTNLVEIAIKSTEPGDAVTVKVRCQKDNIYFEVIDEGPGFDPDLFETSISYKNQGRKENNDFDFAISMANNLTTIMGGVLSIKNNKRKGSTVMLKAPLIVGDNESISLEKQNEFKQLFSSENKVLVIEDDQMNTEVYRAWFEEFKFQTIFAANGKEGIDLAISEKPDLILTDLLLPCIDGISVIKQVRKVNLLKKVPIVVISASTLEESRQKAFEFGCNEYLEKPLNFNELVDLLKKYLRFEDQNDTRSNRFPILNNISAIKKNELFDYFKATKNISVIHLDKLISSINKINHLFKKNGCQKPSFVEALSLAAYNANSQEIKQLIEEAERFYESNTDVIKGH